MKQIEVSCCRDCGFLCRPYDHINEVEVNYCRLGKLRIKDSVDSNNTPDWCPLLKEDYQITHKDRSERHNNPFSGTNSQE